jgi:serine protease Do
MSGLERLPELRMEIERTLGRGALGISVQSMTPELAQHFGAAAGVLVSAVRGDSPAAKAGIAVGDVITTVDGERIDGPGDLRRRVRDSEREKLTIGLVRDKKQLSVDVPVERPARREIMTRRWSA